MTSVDLNIDNLIINKLTRSQWTSLCSLGRIHENEIYDIIDNDDYFYQKSQTSSSLDLSTEFAKYTIINKLTQAEYDQLCSDGEIDDKQIYCITDSEEDQLSDVLSDYYTKTETSSSQQIRDEFSKYQLSGDYSSVTVNDVKSDLNVHKMTMSEYTAYVESKSESELSNHIFDISSDTLDAFGRKITNVADPTEDTDGANKKYVDDKVPTRVSDLNNDLNFISLTSLNGYVQKTSIIPEGFVDGVKIATIGDTEIFAPQGGGSGSGGGEALAPCIIVLDGSSSSGGDATIGGVSIGTSETYNHFTLNGQEITINNLPHVFVVYVPVDDQYANTVHYCYSGSCLKYDTLITMSDGSVKQIKDIKVGDKILSMNPTTRQLDEDEVIVAETSEDRVMDKYTVWTFDDGTEVSTVNRHRFYNKDLNEFLYLEAWLDESAVKSDSKSAKLVSKKDILEKVHHCTIFTKRWNNYFANGLLSGNRNSVSFK